MGEKRIGRVRVLEKEIVFHNPLKSTGTGGAKKAQ